MTADFLDIFSRVVRESEGNQFTDNYDHRRYGPEPMPAAGSNRPVSLVAQVKACAAKLLRHFSAPSVPSPAERALQWVRPHRQQFQWLYDVLADSRSKELLILILAHRTMGHERVKLPLNNADYWRLYAAVEKLTVGAESLPLNFRDWQAYRINLQTFGYPIELFARPGGIMTQMLLQQYRCDLGTTSIEVRPGDIVIDGGACYGDTALYFAHKTGPTGRVYSFEFLPDNLAVFERNLAMNPDYSQRIRPVRHPLWVRSGVELYIEGSGPGTRVVTTPDQPTAQSVTTLSIDDLVAREGLERIDFIKMDIEGAELKALQGAVETLRRFRPKLALSIYHRIEDFWEIPQWLDGLNLDYKFYLRHFTIHMEETVLFAEARIRRLEGTGLNGLPP